MHCVVILWSLHICSQNLLLESKLRQCIIFDWVMSFENLLTRKRRRRLLTWWERDRRSHATTYRQYFYFFLNAEHLSSQHFPLFCTSLTFRPVFIELGTFFQIFFLFWLYNIISINYFQYDMISKCLRLKLFGLNIYFFILYIIYHKHVCTYCSQK